MAYDDLVRPIVKNQLINVGFFCFAKIFVKEMITHLIKCKNTMIFLCLSFVLIRIVTPHEFVIQI